MLQPIDFGGISPHITIKFHIRISDYKCYCRIIFFRNAKKLTENKYHIEVIDSQTVAMGLGLIVITAARLAQDGAKLSELTDFVRRAMKRSHFIAYFDTLKYLAKGGRIGRAQGLLGSLLSVKPILTVKEGEMSPVTQVRTRTAGMDYFYNFVTGFPKVEELAVEYATTPDEADNLVERLYG